jgi:hypothetical protein
MRPIWPIAIPQEPKVVIVMRCRTRILKSRNTDSLEESLPGGSAADARFTKFPESDRENQQKYSGRDCRYSK